MSRRRRARRNPLGLSNTELALAGVGAAGVVGTIAYLALRKGSSSCWQLVTGAFTLTPGHYRIEMMLSPSQLAQAQTQFSQLATMQAALDELHTALPGLKIGGMWLGRQAFPQGTPLPSDWPRPGGPEPTLLRVDILNAYSTAGTPYAGKPVPAGMVVWSCSTGPIPAQEALPANLVAVLGQLAAAAQGGGGAPIGGGVKKYQPGTASKYGIVNVPLANTPPGQHHGGP